MSARVSGGKVLLGLGVAGGIGAALYFLLRKKAPQGSSPSEWALPSFTTTSSAMVSLPPSMPNNIDEGSGGYEPFEPNPYPGTGTHPGKVEVVPVGEPCTYGCGDGICVNGRCEFA